MCSMEGRGEHFRSFPQRPHLHHQIVQSRWIKTSVEDTCADRASPWLEPAGLFLELVPRFSKAVEGKNLCGYPVRPTQVMF